MRSRKSDLGVRWLASRGRFNPMKTPLVLGFAVFAGTLSAVSAADQAAAAVNARFVDGDEPEIAEIRKLGDYAVTRLGMTLANEVAVAVNKTGAEKAIDICHLKALPMSRDGITGLPRIKELKRTSLKLRNPANAPDPAEQLALDRVQKDLEAGVPPKVLIQQINLPTGGKEWRVYRPIAVAPQCLTCHGPRDSFPPELRARLAERYPKDEAVGYAAGQWRGLIRVTVSDATPVPTASRNKKT